MTVRPNPVMSDASPTSPRSGKELAVLGSFFGSAPDVAAGAAGGAAPGAPAVERGGAAAVERAGAGAAAAGEPAPPLLLASVASTCFSVRTFGGFDVMMVAVN